MTFSGATPPAAVPDPPPDAPAAPLAAVPDPVPIVPPEPEPPADAEPEATEPAKATQGTTAETASPAVEQAVARPRRRQPDKHTIYPDAALKDKLEDLTLTLQRKHRKRAGGRVDKGVIHDAVLAVALAHPAEIDKYLREYLS
jgi:hypothetical protein